MRTRVSIGKYSAKILTDLSSQNQVIRIKELAAPSQTALSLIPNHRKANSRQTISRFIPVARKPRLSRANAALTQRQQKMRQRTVRPTNQPPVARSCHLLEHPLPCRGKLCRLGRRTDLRPQFRLPETGSIELRRRGSTAPSSLPTTCYRDIHTRRSESSTGLNSASGVVLQHCTTTPTRDMLSLIEIAFNQVAESAGDMPLCLKARST